MPWLCALPLALSLLDRRQVQERWEWPAIPDARGLIADYAEAHPSQLPNKIYRTYAYFDPLSHAVKHPLSLLKISAGGRDPSCKPPTSLRGLQCADGARKEMLFLPSTGHEIVPAMHEAHGKLGTTESKQKID